MEFSPDRTSAADSAMPGGTRELQELVRLIDELMLQSPPTDGALDVNNTERDLLVLKQWADGPFVPQQQLMAHHLNALSRSAVYFISKLANRCSGVEEDFQQLQVQVSELINKLSELKEELDRMNRPVVRDTESRLRTAVSSVGELFYSTTIVTPWALSGVAVISLAANRVYPAWEAWMIWSWGAAGTAALCALALVFRWLLLPFDTLRSRWKLVESVDGLSLKLRNGQAQKINLTAPDWYWTTSWLGYFLGLSWIEFQAIQTCTPLLIRSREMRQRFESRLKWSVARSTREVGHLVGAALAVVITVVWGWNTQFSLESKADVRYLWLWICGFFFCGAASLAVGLILGRTRA